MQTNSPMTRALLVTAAGLSLFTASSQAAFNAARGNILFGANELNPSPGPFDLVVDLGSYTQFTGASNPILLGGSSASESYQGFGATSQGRFSAADVTALFGNLDNVVWSTFGIDSGASATANSKFFISSARTDVNTVAPGFAQASSFSQGGTGNKLETVRNAANGQGTGLTATPNTAVKIDSALAGSYNNQLAAAGYDASENNTTTGTARSDFYYQPFTGGGTVTRLGYFELQNDGDLWFVPSTFVPVPEASTYGLVGGAGLLMLVMRRQFASKTA